MEVYHAAPDGYTLLAHSVDTMLSAYMIGVFPVEAAARMEIVATIVQDPHAVSVRYDSPFQNMQDLIDYALANPGALSFGAAGTGTASHLSAVVLWDEAGFEGTYVPFDGSAPARNAVMGGHIDVLASQTSEAFAFHQAEELRILGIWHHERLSFLPDVPTMEEQGLNLFGGQTRGIWAPEGTPADVIEYLEAAIYGAYSNPDFQALLIQNLGFNPAWMGTAESRAYQDQRRIIVEEVVRRIGLM
jgi:tripartite-type tricarboxylate transporter receptor subunit TctC